MKKKNVLLVFLLVASLCLFAACSGSADVTLDGGNGTNSSGETTGPIQITVDFNLNIDAEEGKDADGFTWENNFSEITITGYIGASNELTVPKTINGKPVTQIKEGALKGFTGLKSIIIPGTIKTIAGVFEDCTGLESVTIEASGLENMKNAFKNCTSLKMVNVPSTVKEMEGAFEGCGSLDCDITIPEGITSLRKTFYCCASLKNIVIPESVTSLENTFVGCVSLQSVRVPAAVTNVRSTFSGCSSLENVEILAQVTEMFYTFSGCTSLKSIEIPQSVTELYGTFDGCTSLTNVEIPESVTRLPYTFEDCSALEEIVIPENVSELCSTFNNCVSLKKATFANLDRHVIDTYGAFNGCTSLKTLDLPINCTFGGYGCIALEELTIRTTEQYYWVQELQLGYLPALKKLTILSEEEDFELTVYSTSESSYTQFVAPGDDMYERLLEQARQASTNRHGYRYYAEELDDGTECRRLIGIYDSGAWNAEPIPLDAVESRARVDNQIIYTLYSSALIGDDLTPGVILYKTVETQFLEYSRPEYKDGVCGAEFYAECEYSEYVEVNGVLYPLKEYVYSED